jgi:hypothetical protein
MMSAKTVSSRAPWFNRAVKLFRLAGCVRLAAQDERLPAGRRQQVATAYGDRALAALRQAIDKRAKETAQMPKDPGLDPLRSREDFRQLLAEWEARRKP